MNDDYHYYKERCTELEMTLAAAQKTIVNLERKIYDVRMAIKDRTHADAIATLDAISYTIYNWDNK